MTHINVCFVLFLFLFTIKLNALHHIHLALLTRVGVQESVQVDLHLCCHGENGSMLGGQDQVGNGGKKVVTTF